MRLNGNFFNFMNSSFFNRSAMISKLLGSRNAGNMNMPDGNRVDKHSPTYMKDGVLYQKGNRRESKLYTRRGTWADARPKQDPNRRNAFRPLREDLKKVHYDAALGIIQPKEMSVKDNEVRFDDNSCYQFTGKDGKLHTVLSASGLLSADVFGRKGPIDEEAAEYANFWERLAQVYKTGFSRYRWAIIPIPISFPKRKMQLRFVQRKPMTNGTMRWSAERHLSLATTSRGRRCQSAARIMS